MATTVTLTFDDHDTQRCVNATESVGRLFASQASYLTLNAPPGASNAATLKAWLITLAQQATIEHEAAVGGAPLGAFNPAPAIT